MVAIKASDVDRALRQRRPDQHPVVLVYGPDQGLVSERARAAAEAAVDDPSDPFQLVRLDGDAVAAEPGRLAEEAGTIGLFGGRRSLWVRQTSRNLVPAVTVCLDLDLRDTSIVVEGGDLGRSSPLRTLCERSPRALVLPCYEDQGRALSDLVDAALKEGGLTMGRAEKTYLLESLGGDRLASRGELAKLALYVHGRSEITLADIDAVVSDVSAGEVDSAIDAAFAGRLAEADHALQQQARTALPQALGTAIRHTLALIAARAEIERGSDIDGALGRWRGLHFSRKNAVQRQLGLWDSRDLSAVLERLQGAMLATRRNAALSGPIASRALLDIARQARRRSGGG